MARLGNETWAHSPSGPIFGSSTKEEAQEGTKEKARIPTTNITIIRLALRDPRVIKAEVKKANIIILAEKRTTGGKDTCRRTARGQDKGEHFLRN